MVPQARTWSCTSCLSIGESIPGSTESVPSRGHCKPSLPRRPEWCILTPPHLIYINTPGITFILVAPGQAFRMVWRPTFSRTLSLPHRPNSDANHFEFAPFPAHDWAVHSAEAREVTGLSTVFASAESLLANVIKFQYFCT